MLQHRRSLMRVTFMNFYVYNMKDSLFLTVVAVGPVSAAL
jgi:hypothetical protein